MTIKNALFVLLFLALFIETTFISFPLFLILAVILYLVYEDMLTLFFVFLASLMLDSLKLANPGSTILIVAIALIVLEALKRVFDTKDYKFILVFLLVASYAYAKWAGYDPSVLSYIILYVAVGSFLYYLSSKKFPWLK